MTGPLFALVSALALVGAPLQAQTGGEQASPATAPVALTGLVTNSSAGQPLAEVVIEVPAFGLAGLTNPQGRYALVLPDSLVGRTVEVTATYLGYGVGRDTVTLVPDGSVLDFQLDARAVQIEGMVVTGSASVAQRREIGNTIGFPASGAISLRSALDPGPRDREGYAHIDENGFRPVSSAPLSTFSIDVDRASYSNVRRFLMDGRLPPADAVRIEELVNYFPYDDPGPAGDSPFAVTTELTDAPWNPAHHLLRIGLKGKSIDMADAAPANMVFLMDVSGSMGSPDKLPLLKTAFRMLVESMRPQDRVAIVVYAGSAGEVLPSTSGNEKPMILEAIERLRAGGSTAGGAGIRLAYDIAAKNHIPGGNNRVILATDGDFNVGASSDSEMIRLIEEKREQGTFLTVLGFGTGNLQDAKMEQIADHGNGSFHYIDSALEARKSLVTEAGGTLVTIAKDVKIQIEFNPTTVAGYRLIGYENRLLADEDFNDDTKDAGELGAGHSVVALYEVIPAGLAVPGEASVDPLRYSNRPEASGVDDEIAFVKLRWKAPDGDESRLSTHPVSRRIVSASGETRFAAAVAAWGMLLRDSEFVGGFGFDGVRELARGARGEDAGGYRAEFMRLVDLSDGLVTQREEIERREEAAGIDPSEYPDFTGPIVLLVHEEIASGLLAMAARGPKAPFDSGPAPIIYRDGERVDPAPGDFRDYLLSVDPPEIGRIEVITGPAAVTLYGSDAAAGVVQIFSKGGSPAG